MRRGFIAAIALLWGCDDGGSRVFVDLSRFGRELALLASVDAQGRVVEQRVVALDASDTGALLLSVPAGGELLALAFDRGPLRALAPRHEATREAELRFTSRARLDLSCPEGLLDFEARVTRGAWPSDSRAFRLGPDDATVTEVASDEGRFSALSLEVPVHPERCADHPEIALRPFAPDLPLFRPGFLVGGVAPPPGRHDLNDLVRLDADRALLAYGYSLLVARRGVGYEDGATRFVPVGPGRRFRSIAAGPAQPDGRRRVVFVKLIQAPQEEPTGSEVFDTLLDGLDFSPPRRLHTTERLIDSVYVEPSSGRALLFEQPGQILRERTAGDGFEPVAELPDTQPTTDKRGRFAESGVPAYPVMLLGARPVTVYLGTADGRQWINVGAQLTPGYTYRAFAVRDPLSEEPHYYAGNTGGFLLHRRASDREWRSLTARLSPALIGWGCGATMQLDACGFLEPSHEWRHLSAAQSGARSDLLVGIGDVCALSFMVDERGCTSHFTWEGTAPTARPSEDQVMIARVEAGFLTVATELGALFEQPMAELGVTH